MALIKANKTGAPIVYFSPEHPETHPKTSFIAGSFLQGNMVTRKTKEGNLQVCASMSVRRPKKYDQFIKDAENAIMSNSIRFTSPENIPLYCYCNTPGINVGIPDDEFNRDVALCGCKDVFHAECLSITPKDFDTLLCASCTANVITPGVTWSARPDRTDRSSDSKVINNTCPVDSFLTYSTMFNKEQNKDLQSYFEGDQQSENLVETMRLVKEQKFNAAQVKYYDELKKMNDDHMKKDFVKQQVEAQRKQREALAIVQKQNEEIDRYNDEGKKKKIKGFVPKARVASPVVETITKPIPQLREDDMWGSADERVNAKHYEGFKIGIKSQCNNLQCHLNHESINYDKHYDMLELRDVTKIGDVITKGQEYPCPACKYGSFKESSFILDEKNWALSIHINNLAVGSPELIQAKKDIHNLKIPRTITMPDGKQYGLAAVNFSEAEYHFTSAIWIPSAGEFVWYDGMDKTKKIRKCNFQTDFMKPSRYIDSVEYLRLG